MSLPYQSTARCCIRAARSSYSRNTLQCTSTLRRTASRRWQSTDAVAATSPKIEGIVSEIGKLTLLETADLIKELKVCVLAEYDIMLASFSRLMLWPPYFPTFGIGSSTVIFCTCMLQFEIEYGFDKNDFNNYFANILITLPLRPVSTSLICQWVALWPLAQQVVHQLQQHQ